MWASEFTVKHWTVRQQTLKQNSRELSPLNKALTQNYRFSTHQKKRAIKAHSAEKETQHRLQNTHGNGHLYSDEPETKPISHISENIHSVSNGCHPPIKWKLFLILLTKEDPPSWCTPRTHPGSPAGVLGIRKAPRSGGQDNTRPMKAVRNQGLDSYT